HTRFSRDWSSDVCSSDLGRRRTGVGIAAEPVGAGGGVDGGDALVAWTGAAAGGGQRGALTTLRSGVVAILRHPDQLRDIEAQQRSEERRGGERGPALPAG